ncbi:hypothetical protein ABQ366_06880 [Serratia fonticola]|uniref:hypothetical protein n=1 Tax=Serratia fonticola TaxID=47917 RepID=UPI003AB02AA3
MITKNFRLNALANQYAAAVYDRVKQQNGGDFFMIETGPQAIRVEIAGGIPGVRELVDSYYLEALQLNYRNWETVAMVLLTQCVDGPALTMAGLEVWESMVNDIGSTVEGQAQ